MVETAGAEVSPLMSSPREDVRLVRVMMTAVYSASKIRDKGSVAPVLARRTRTRRRRRRINEA